MEPSAKIVDYYRAAVESKDERKLLETQQLIDSAPVFSSWTKGFSDAATRVDLPQRPLPLELTSPVSNALLRMIESEGQDDNDRGDNSGEKAS